MYQAIRSCRGVAPIFIPGASELFKLVEPAEAWAVEACKTLKIQVFALRRLQRAGKRLPCWVLVCRVSGVFIKARINSTSCHSTIVVGLVSREYSSLDGVPRRAVRFSGRASFILLRARITADP